MNTIEFDYDLPNKFIAQTPLTKRDDSRLLVLDRQNGSIAHRRFFELDDLLSTGDLLVLNKTRVIPARIIGRKSTGGKVEILLLRKETETCWRALVGGKGLNEGKTIELDGGPNCEVVQVFEGAERRLKFKSPIEPVIKQFGKVPLPPYIHTELSDPERYQTIFAQETGSAAAPTAGLHFSEELFTRLSAKGINTTEVTLHVGLDTFAPVTEKDPMTHIIHKEWCQISEAACDAINQTKKKGGKVIAVGTTSVRTLETAGNFSSEMGGGTDIKPFTGDTDLFILPGFKFRVVDALITNFHLPKSTLLMLVSAFAGRERILEAYETAKKENYRFFSFGDAMLIL